MLYGEVELEMRHDRGAGIVAAFITMSDDRDEIDWEFSEWTMRGAAAACC